ncbi:MAG: YigZ family protein [Lachnospiraceae bacterium]|nr:YigZ family protein [Lachnospiraceae bacterium]
MKLYSTVMGRGEAEQTIERSRFIAHVAPCESREEAEEFFDAIRRRYRDATHNVPAMVLGEKQQVQWASDDGEPQGTSGAPMVQLMVKQGITNTAIIVTRYFGGIKLGTGGLVRAYTSSAKIGLEAAGICDVEERTALTFFVDYKAFNRVQNYSFGEGIQIVDVQYTDRVGFTAVCEDAEECQAIIRGLTNGAAELVSQEQKRIHVPMTL